MVFACYEISWLKVAHKQFLVLPNIEQQKILLKINALVLVENNLDIKKIKGHKDLYRIRSGDYRIIYSVDKGQRLISIAAIGHRRDIYNQLKLFSFLFVL